jgi:hypothetical protein
LSTPAHQRVTQSVNFQENTMKVKVKNISKKIASILLLSVGLLFLEFGVKNALLTHYVLSTSADKLNLSAIFFWNNSLLDIGIGLIIITFASFLWDWKKNWKIYGIFLCVVGFNFIVQTFDTLSNRPFKDISPFDKVFPTSIIIGFISFSILFFVIGISIVKRTKRNRDDKNTLTQE